MRIRRKLKQKVFLDRQAAFSEIHRTVAFRKSTPSSTSDRNCASKTSFQGKSVFFARSTVFAMSKGEDVTYVSAEADGDITKVKVDINNNSSKVMKLIAVGFSLPKSVKE